MCHCCSLFHALPVKMLTSQVLPVVAAAERSPDTKEQSEGERGKTRRMCPE